MATWTKTIKFSGQTPATYNQAGLTYNQINYIYNGRQGTLWSKATKN